MSDSTTDPKTKSASSDVPEPIAFDIEHMPVADDPRKWSNFRKNFVLAQVAFGSVLAGLGANIQSAAITEMEADLPATPSQFSLSMSLFMLLQGIFPLMWASISEVKGRKLIYIISMILFTAGSAVVATSNSIGLLIGFRCLQAAGSSAVLSIGAATLADIFDPAERGRKMGFYYVAPLLGASLSPIIGGGLTSAFTWRGAFWFCTIDGGVVFLSFLLLFKDTYRCERSLTYQNVLKVRLREAARKKALGEEKAEITSEDTGGDSAHEKSTQNLKKQDVTVTEAPITGEDTRGDSAHENSTQDLEKQDITVTEASKIIPEVKLGLRDINPFTPMLLTIRRTYNVFMLLASGFNFSFEFVVIYTTSRSLSTYYHYSPVKIGLTLLAFGLGTVIGSLFGGRWSDYQLARLKAKNGGQGTPEMRLRSTVHALVMFPLCVAGFAWVLQERVHIAGVCVMLFACGFLAYVVYASSLTYIVDSNLGRSGSAIALNSFFRCTLAFIMEEVAVPMQDALGDGWMYTIIAVIIALTSLLIVAVIYKGAQWRAEADARELAAQEKL